MRKIKAEVKGIVQGVGFRYFVLHIAKRMNLRGFVKNLENGNVYVEAAGDEKTLNEFIDKLWEGPNMAQVEDIDLRWEDSSFVYSDFEIEY